MTLNTASRAIIGIAGIGAVHTCVTEPMVGRPAFSGQPATHEPSQLHVSALTGGYQARGRGR